VDEIRDHVGYVYFIRAPSVNRIKIGWSAYNPDARFVELNVSSPVMLEKFALMRGPQSLEGETHARFKRLRKKGEWFRIAEPLLTFIAENARDWKEYQAEQSAAAEISGRVEYEERTRELRSAVQQAEDHAGTCYMLGIDPNSADADEQLLAEKTARRRRPRYGPLQALLDKLKADESSRP
jgi:hypothetical protein